MVEKLPLPSELMAERIKSDSRPGNRNDDFKLGLIFQGGTMRGIVSAGLGVGIESRIGDCEPFDCTDDTSAATYHWSFMASRRGVEGTSIYYEELAKNFIAIRNFKRLGKIINLSILIDTVSEGPKALDFDRLINHPTETNFYATSVLDAKPVKFRIGESAINSEASATDESYTYPCKTKEEVLLSLEASAHLPWYAGQPVMLAEEMLLVDGGISAGRVPLSEAIAAGCTHILVLATDKSDLVSKYKRDYREKFAARMIRDQFPTLAQHYWRGHDYHHQVLKLLDNPPDQSQTPVIEVVRAPNRSIPSSLETNPLKLYLAAKAGEWAVDNAFKAFGLKRDPRITVRPPRKLTF